MIVTTVKLGSARAQWNSHRQSARTFSCLLSSALAAIIVCSAHLPAHAVPINYGSHVGTTVDYINVTEDTTTGDSQPLFGARYTVPTRLILIRLVLTRRLLVLAARIPPAHGSRS